MSADRFDPGPRTYPRTWLLLEVLERRGRVLGQEVVDLSPGAIELRHVVRDLRGWAEEPERWIRVDEESVWPALEAGHRRSLSFGPDLGYCVEHDPTERVHAGQPFRHLALRLASGVLTPATSAEIGVYFYGRRPASFGLTRPDAAHGYIGLDWEPLESEDVRWLLGREREEGSRGE